jgi:hypothetical protein
MKTTDTVPWHEERFYVWIKWLNLFTLLWRAVFYFLWLAMDYNATWNFFGASVTITIFDGMSVALYATTTAIAQFGYPEFMKGRRPKSDATGVEQIRKARERNGALLGMLIMTTVEYIYAMVFMWGFLGKHSNFIPTHASQMAPNMPEPAVNAYALYYFSGNGAFYMNTLVIIMDLLLIYRMHHGTETDQPIKTEAVALFGGYLHWYAATGILLWVCLFGLAMTNITAIYATDGEMMTVYLSFVLVAMVLWILHAWSFYWSKDVALMSNDAQARCVGGHLASLFLIVFNIFFLGYFWSVTPRHDWNKMPVWKQGLGGVGQSATFFYWTAVCMVYAATLPQIVVCLATHITMIKYRGVLYKHRPNLVATQLANNKMYVVLRGFGIVALAVFTAFFFQELFGEAIITRNFETWSATTDPILIFLWVLLLGAGIMTIRFRRGVEESPYGTMTAVNFLVYWSVMTFEYTWIFWSMNTTFPKLSTPSGPDRVHDNADRLSVYSPVTLIAFLLMFVWGFYYVLDYLWDDVSFINMHTHRVLNKDDHNV